MLTLAVVLTAEQPPAAAIVYVTVYVPAALGAAVIVTVVVVLTAEQPAVAAIV